MNIPKDSLSVSGLRLQNGRLQAPEATTPEVKDIVQLANRELAANDQLRAELRSLDNTDADSDPREGKVRLSNYGMGNRQFYSLSLDGDKLSGTAVGRGGSVFDCRSVDGSDIKVQSDYGLPGAVPGLSFRVRSEGSGQTGETVSLIAGFSRHEMVMRMTKDDLSQAVKELPEGSGVNQKFLGKQLASAHGDDFIAIQNEFSDNTKRALDNNLLLLDKAKAYMSGLSLLGLAATQANLAPLAIGIFVGGMTAGYAAIKYLDHQANVGFKAGSELSNLQSHLAKNATQLPQSFVG